MGKDDEDMLDFVMAGEAMVVEDRIVMFRETAMDMDTSIGSIKEDLREDLYLHNRHAKMEPQLLKNQPTSSRPRVSP